MLQLLSLQFSLSLNYFKTLDGSIWLQKHVPEIHIPLVGPGPPFAASVKINAPKSPAALDEQCPDFCFVPWALKVSPA